MADQIDDELPETPPGARERRLPSIITRIPDHSRPNDSCRPATYAEVIKACKLRKSDFDIVYKRDLSKYVVGECINNHSYAPLYFGDFEGTKNAVSVYPDIAPADRPLKNPCVRMDIWYKNRLYVSDQVREEWQKCESQLLQVVTYCVADGDFPAYDEFYKKLSKALKKGEMTQANRKIDRNKAIKILIDAKSEAVSDLEVKVINIYDSCVQQMEK
jgi:hypothetical protein